MRPAHTGHGIISDGKLDGGITALLSIRLTAFFISVISAVFSPESMIFVRCKQPPLHCRKPRPHGPFSPCCPPPGRRRFREATLILKTPAPGMRYARS